MQGSLLRFYVHEGHRHRGRPVWEWLLEQAREAGVGGGSAFRAMAGFGGHRVLHESSFFELAGSLTVEVEFVVTAAEEQRILDLVQAAGLRVFYTSLPARFGVTGGGQPPGP